MLERFARIERDVYKPKNRKFNKNTDTRWRVVYPNPDSLGVRKESFSSENAALKRAAFLNNSSPKELSHDKWKVSDAADFWKENRLIKLRSYERELSKVNRIKKEFGLIQIKELTEVHIKRFKASLQNGRSVRTVNSYLVTLRTILNYSKKKGLASSFPDISEYIESSLEVKRDRVITASEFQRLLDACKVKRHGRSREHLIPYLIWLHETGCRTGELAKIAVKDIDLARGVIRIWSGKAKRPVQRECGITPRLSQLIVHLNILTQDDESLIFAHQLRWQRSFATACRIANIKNFRMHDLRRTAVTNMLEKGIPLHLVAKMVGHSSNSVLTLDVYTRFRSDFIKEMMLKMG